MFLHALALTNFKIRILLTHKTIKPEVIFIVEDDFLIKFGINYLIYNATNDGLIWINAIL